MKKTFALVMAALMTASMTTVAFAAKKDTVEELNLTGWYAYDYNDDGVFEKARPFADFKLADHKLAGGTTVYFGLEALYELADGNHETLGVQKLSDLDRWDIVTEWEVGDLEEKPYFDVIKVEGNRQVVLAIEIPENKTTKNKELLGKIGLGETTSKARENMSADINITYGNDATGYIDELKEFDGAFPVGYENGAVVNFKGVEDEIDIEFGEVALFTVDVTGQGKLDLRFDTKYNADFNEQYEYANIEYLNFKNNPIFNRNGVMYIYADEDSYLYEVTEDGAKEVKGAEYDEDEGAFVFKTRTLKSYAISDEELDTVDEIGEGDVSVSKPEAGDTTTSTGKPNPDTGR